LNELRRVEAEAAERPVVDPGPAAEPDPAPAGPELASSREGSLASSGEEDLEAFDRLFPPLPLPPPLPFRLPRPGDRAYEGPSGAPKG
jgi:hypothetical protein